MSHATRTEGNTRAFLDAVCHKDMATVTDMLDDRITVTVSLSFDGSQRPAGRFVGKDAVLGYFRGVFTRMAVIEFTDVRVSVTGDGATSFVQADGDFTAADGRPYRNVYVNRHDWHGDRVVNLEEYANPITFTNTFGDPTGA